MGDLQKFRKEINKIDKILASLLRKRIFYVKKIGQLKCAKKLKLTDKKREKAILTKLKTDYEKDIFKKIIEKSKKIQNQVLTKS